MNEIQIFTSKEFGQVRTIEENGKVLFCGRDVGKALGYAIPSKAVNTHCKGVSKLEVPTNGGVQKMLFITEGDLYRLISHSELPSAEEFESWIFDELLPTIRQTGGYIPTNESDTDQEILAKAVLISQKTIELQKQKINDLEISNSSLTVENTKMQPKADYFDDLVDKNLLTGIRETAKELKITQNKFVDFLLNNKFVYRDKKNKLQPYASSTKDGLFEVKECSNRSNGWSGTQTLITPKGRETFRLLCLGI